MGRPSLFWRVFLKLVAFFSVYALTMIWGIGHAQDPWQWGLITSFVAILLLAFALNYFLEPLHQVLDALESGVSAFNDGDFSLTVHHNGYRELDRVVALYNQLAGILREERMNIFQRELLLDTVIQSTPVALLLADSKGKVVYSNAAAKALLGVNGKLEGHKLAEVIAHLSPQLITAFADKFNGLVTDRHGDQSLVYNLNCQHFMLNGLSHDLYLVKNLSDEMSRKETQMWKQVIRLISHELNNSLAPISSLTRSARKILDHPEHAHMLQDVLDTIGKRSQHLSDFISEYARFARLPKPQIKEVELESFYLNLKTLLEVDSECEVLTPSAYFDPAQIEQVMINLVKNALESGSARQEVGFKISQQANHLNFIVYDRGSGLSEAQIQQALLPFYTTKEKGSGVGLALCNEITIAHGGKLRLYNRDNGGLCVSVELQMSAT